MVDTIQSQKLCCSKSIISFSIIAILLETVCCVGFGYYAIANVFNDISSLYLVFCVASIAEHIFATTPSIILIVYVMFFYKKVKSNLFVGLFYLLLSIVGFLNIITNTLLNGPAFSEMLSIGFMLDFCQVLIIKSIIPFLVVGFALLGIRKKSIYVIAIIFSSVEEISNVCNYVFQWQSALDIVFDKFDWFVNYVIFYGEAFARVAIVIAVIIFVVENISFLSTKPIDKIKKLFKKSNV